jgi:hypothetical protein
MTTLTVVGEEGSLLAAGVHWLSLREVDCSKYSSDRNSPTCEQRSQVASADLWSRGVDFRSRFHRMAADGEEVREEGPDGIMTVAERSHASSDTATTNHPKFRRVAPLVRLTFRQRLPHIGSCARTAADECVKR